MGTEESTIFGKENSLTLPSLANKNFSSIRDENVESIYTYRIYLQLCWPFFWEILYVIQLRLVHINFLSNIKNLTSLVRFLILFHKNQVLKVTYVIV